MGVKPHPQAAELTELYDTDIVARDDALDAATRETGIADLPKTCPRAVGEVLHGDWLPGGGDISPRLDRNA
ncbi:hypothetical protein ThimaDRAFT_2232 [Thiocapsa marina 5811]|uniref:Uncharacterized protein n=1 Tax=Thiocapsa marina 5811 TaxID=768671 RepID=F9UBD0_9GAMM|nr:hypothetical protein ThimaDRAFT_2232 [Thiocapsa marina 5811]